ncbi:MAG: hypothetical protein AAFY15_15655 [Cyanobacteria bacterium J06648_11]
MHEIYTKTAFLTDERESNTSAAHMLARIIQRGEGALWLGISVTTFLITHVVVTYVGCFA